MLFRFFADLVNARPFVSPFRAFLSVVSDMAAEAVDVARALETKVRVSEIAIACALKAGMEAYKSAVDAGKDNHDATSEGIDRARNLAFEHVDGLEKLPEPVKLSVVSAATEETTRAFGADRKEAKAAGHVVTTSISNCNDLKFDAKEAASDIARVGLSVVAHNLGQEVYDEISQAAGWEATPYRIALCSIAATAACAARLATMRRILIADV